MYDSVHDIVRLELQCEHRCRHGVEHRFLTMYIMLKLLFFIIEFHWLSSATCANIGYVPRLIACIYLKSARNVNYSIFSTGSNF